MNSLSGLYYQKEQSNTLHSTFNTVYSLSHPPPLSLSVCRNIAIDTPYSVEQRDNEIIQTYLDTVGRPVVIVKGTNLIEQHIQDFKVDIHITCSNQIYPPPSLSQLTYDFQSWMLLQEPLLVVVALYGFYLLIIIIVRLDFSITKVTMSSVL